MATPPTVSQWHAMKEQAERARLADVSSRESFAAFLLSALKKRELLISYLVCAQDTYSYVDLDAMSVAELDSLYRLMEIPVHPYQ